MLSSRHKLCSVLLRSRFFFEWLEVATVPLVPNAGRQGFWFTAWWVCQEYLKDGCITYGRVRCIFSLSAVFCSLLRATGDPKSSSAAAPIGLVWESCPATGCGTFEASPGPAGPWWVLASDVGRSIRHTKEVGTVKFTYQGLFFFFVCFVCSGVGQCRGCSPG